LNATSDCYWTYILENPQGRFYVGHTDDLDRRVAEHNSPEKVGTKYTHKNGPWRLIWSESHLTRSAAMLRERSIKAKKSARWIRERLLRGQSESRCTGINR
jgi:putative endonuclease